MENINVLSLFDGMSCGQQALDRVGISVNKYYASEVDKHAIIVTQANYPNTMQLGDVRNIHYTNAGIEVDLGPSHVRFIETDIQLLIGGSPCQSFSFAGKRKGMTTKCSVEIISLEQYLELKAAGFEFEGQSYLFWEYVRILKEIRTVNPNVKFLLENVEMAKKWRAIISNTLGVEPIEINSALVSAQNRQRLYWTNIGHYFDGGLFGDYPKCIISQPKDKMIYLKDILQKQVEQKYYLKDKTIKWLIRHSKKRGTYINILNDKPKSNCIKAVDVKCNLETGFIINRNPNKVIQLNNSTESGCTQPYQQNRIYHVHGKSPALLAGMSCGSHAIEHYNGIRRLTPIECERLQTVKEGYTAHVSDTQRYRMLGNGWTVDVIVHIFKHLKNQCQ